MFLIPLYFIYLFLYGYNINKKKILFLFLFLIPFILIFFILRKFSVATFGYQYYVTNVKIFFFNFFKDSFFYFYNFFVPEYIPIIMLNAKLNLRIILYNFLFVFLFVFLLYRKILPKKIFIFSSLLILLSMIPTFFTVYNVYLNHRFFVCSLGLLIIFVSIFDNLVIKINKLKIIFVLFFLIYIISLFFISYKHADKYRNNEEFWINAYVDSPNYYVSCQNLSHIYLNRGDIEKAEYYAKKAIELKSNYSTLIDYANLLMIKGNLEEAEFAFLKIEEDIKGSKNLLYYPLSEIYYKKQDYKKALDYALRAYNIKPYDIEYCKQLIKIYHVLNDYSGELKIYRELLNFDKKNKEYENKIEELKEEIDNKETENA